MFDGFEAMVLGKTTVCISIDKDRLIDDRSHGECQRRKQIDEAG